MQTKMKGFKNKLYLGNGMYLSMYYSKKQYRYKIILEFFDTCGNISRKQIDYCDTYIDAFYHYNYLKSLYFSLF